MVTSAGLFANSVILLTSLAYAASAPVQAQDRQTARRIDSYIQPYVETGNFSGAILVQRKGRIVFQQAYGFADREHQVRNKLTTQFHIASVSMQFTAAAVLRLIDQGSISLNTHVGDYVRGIAGAENITARDLLTERSGLPDINDLLDYSDVLQHHQTPASLIEKIEGHPLLFPPGSKFLHEEHSAYNLLALILEKKTGLAFPAAMRRVLLAPAALRSTGFDDDSTVGAPDVALGYEPEGVRGLKRAASIHWSAKSGNASVYTTVTDQAKWVHSLLEGHLLSASSRQLVLDTSQRVGYGWFRGPNARFDQTAYYMNGRAPGFASFVLYLPRDEMTVVVFSNVYSSATTTIGYDIAAIALGLPYSPFQPSRSTPDADKLKTRAGTFQFGSDFYQPNARITLIVRDGELLLKCPPRDISPLIPLDNDRFMDRSYWEEVRIERDTAGQPIALTYGRFRGTPVKDVP